jgi:23S rRNA (adenine2030-N6)-methyltransferase
MESQQFGGQLKRLGGALEKVDWLHATLRVKGAEKGGLGLYGSGMFIVNPPWTLYDRLAVALPWLVETLGVDDYAAYTLEAQQS